MAFMRLFIDYKDISTTRGPHAQSASILLKQGKRRNFQAMT